jgi:hypothetical protein
MSIGKSGSGWRVYHCHGKKKGKTIAKFKTKKAALRMHRAIQSKRRKK